MEQILVETAPGPTEEVRTLISELDAILSAEYPPSSGTVFMLSALFQPHIRLFGARRDGALARGGVALFCDFADVERM